MGKGSQPRLPGTAGRYRPKTVELAAMADLRALLDRGDEPPSSTALQASFRLMAREIDRAETELDAWRKINAHRELVRTWQALVPPSDGSGALGEQLEAFIASLPASPVGHAEAPGPAPGNVRGRGRKVASAAEPSAPDAAPEVRSRRRRGDRPDDGAALV